MNFDLLYSHKKPQKLNQKDKEALLNLIFKINKNLDKKIEFFILENKESFFGNLSKFVKNLYVKNKILYLEVESKLIFQEIQFMLNSINYKLEINLKESIKQIKEIKR
ncbi:MAG: hypothetical protein ACK4UJ_03075 [Leptonema sp. (in: bacteria)]